jgi:hypothetical protein
VRVDCEENDRRGEGQSRAEQRCVKDSSILVPSFTFNMAESKNNPFSSRLLTDLSVGSEKYQYYNINKLNDERIKKLPFSIKVLLESAVRNADNFAIKEKDIENIVDWVKTSKQSVEIPFKPARVLMQDFTGTAFIIYYSFLSFVIHC